VFAYSFEPTSVRGNERKAKGKKKVAKLRHYGRKEGSGYTSNVTACGGRELVLANE
jgi:hypothetical protein